MLWNVFGRICNEPARRVKHKFETDNFVSGDHLNVISSPWIGCPKHLSGANVCCYFPPSVHCFHVRTSFRDKAGDRRTLLILQLALTFQRHPREPWPTVPPFFLGHWVCKRCQVASGNTVKSSTIWSGVSAWRSQQGDSEGNGLYEPDPHQGPEGGH